MGGAGEEARAVLEGEVGDLGSLLQAAGHPAGSLEGFHFLYHTYWPEVAEQWRSVLGHIAQFQTCGLLAGVEEQAGGPEGLVLLRTSEPYTAFFAAWNLPLYFQSQF